MADNLSGRPIPRPKQRIAARVIPRPKQRIAGRVIPRPKQLLLKDDAANFLGENNVRLAQSNSGPNSPQSGKQKGAISAGPSAIDRIMKIRRRSRADIKAELDGLRPPLNDINESLWIGKGVLRSARGWLKELEDNAPRPHLPAGPSFIPLDELGEALRSIRRWFKNSSGNAPSKKGAPLPSRSPTNRANLARTAISGALDVIGGMKNSEDSASYAALDAKQKLIVSELEQKVEAFEKQEREIQAQIREKVREKENLPPE